MITFNLKFEFDHSMKAGLFQEAVRKAYPDITIEGEGNTTKLRLEAYGTPSVTTLQELERLYDINK